MGRRSSAGHVLVAGLTGLALAAVLDAPALERTATGLPLGAQRSLALAAVRPVAATSRLLRLDRPRLAADRLLGRATTVPTPPTPTAVPTAPASTSPAPVSEPDGTLDTWIIGDSLVELLGPHLSGRLDESGGFNATVDFRFISGLVRRDFFDWPSHISGRVRRAPPDVVVVMFGGNDGQSVEEDGVVYEKFSAAWWRLYRSRVAEVMDALRADALRAYWLGLPVMRSDTFTAHARSMNEVYRTEALKRPWMRYVSTWSVLADARGRYADYLPIANGELRLMRYEDGVHFTPNGAARLARHVSSAIERDQRP